MGCHRHQQQGQDQDRYIWSDHDVCVRTSASTATISSVHDLDTSLGSWTCSDISSGSFTGPVSHLNGESYLGLINGHDLVLWSISTNTTSIKYSCEDHEDQIRSYDLHPESVLILLNTGRLRLLCRQTFQLLHEYHLNNRTQSVTLIPDTSQIASIQSRPERQIQFFSLDNNIQDLALESISLRHPPIMIQSRSSTEIFILQSDLISLWSIPYRSCIWSLALHSHPIHFTYLERSSSIAILAADGLHIESVPDLSPGLASVLCTGSQTRLLSGQSGSYSPTPDTRSEYLQAIKNRAPDSPLDLQKHSLQISEAINLNDFNLVSDLIRAAPEHIPRSLFTQLIDLNQHELVHTLLPIAAALDEEQIVELLVRSVRHGGQQQEQLVSRVLSLPKTDSVIVRHLSCLSADQIADLFSSLISLLESASQCQDQVLINWICLVIDARPIHFIHHDRCRALLQEWEPVIGYMAYSSMQAETLSSLLSVYQRQSTACCTTSGSGLKSEFNSDKIETITW